MTPLLRKAVLVASLGFALSVGAASAGAAELKDGPVKRGTKVEELKAQLGEPQNVSANDGEGVRVERWYYPDNVVVIVQEGYVIDSFVERK